MILRSRGSLKVFNLFIDPFRGEVVIVGYHTLLLPYLLSRSLSGVLSCEVDGRSTYRWRKEFMVRESIVRTVSSRLFRMAAISPQWRPYPKRSCNISCWASGSVRTRAWISSASACLSAICSGSRALSSYIVSLTCSKETLRRKAALRNASATCCAPRARARRPAPCWTGAEILARQEPPSRFPPEYPQHLPVKGHGGADGEKLLRVSFKQLFHRLVLHTCARLLQPVSPACEISVTISFHVAET